MQEELRALPLMLLLSTKLVSGGQKAWSPPRPGEQEKKNQQQTNYIQEDREGTRESRNQRGEEKPKLTHFSGGIEESDRKIGSC